MEIKAAPEFYISAASVGEIDITHVLGKIKGDPQDFHRAIDALGLRELAIRGAHTLATANSHAS